MSTATAPPPPHTNNGHASLLPEHLQDLAASGLTAETIRAAGLRSESDASVIAKLLRCRGSYARDLGPCLVYPFPNADGTASGYCRLKPINPQPARAKKGDDGPPRKKKYEAPAGVGNHAYFPPGTLQALTDPSIELVVVEGEKKALASDQAGFPTIGVSGVWNWCQKRPRRADGSGRGQFKLIDSLAAVKWQGRRVVIVFDSDVGTNENVEVARLQLAAALTREGASVFAVDLPAGPGDEKQGLDDYLLRQTPDDLRKLLAEAKPPTRPQKEDGGALEAEDDPHRLARLFLAAEANHASRTRLAFYREAFHEWTGQRWRGIPDSEFGGRLARFCARQLREDAKDAVASWDGKGKPPVARKVTTGLIGSVRQALAGEVVIPQTTPQPVWLEDSLALERNLIALENGLLDVDALLSGGDDILLPRSPCWFSPVCLPYKFDPSATCPRWRAVLERNLADKDKIFLLQQFAGYLLLPDTSHQRFFLMLGEGGNGKSVILAVLEAMLGRDNIASVPLEMFGDRFRLSGTLGKLANLTAEVGELDRIAEGQLKAFVVGDPMDFEVKFKPAITARPTARLVLVTNNAPAFSDKSDGLWRRAMVLRFTVQIPPAEQIARMDKPPWWKEQGELPGILNWALAGLHALRQQGGFVIPDSCQAETEKLRTDANPARRFLCENYAYVGGDTYVTCEETYRSYTDWCKQVGHHQLADIGFGREVARLFPQMDRRQKSLATGRKWCYLGVDRRDE